MPHNHEGEQTAYTLTKPGCSQTTMLFSTFNRVFKGGRGASLAAQTVQNLPATQETWIQSLDREHPVEKGMATHSSILAWRIPWTKKSGGLQFMGSQRVRHNWMNYHRYIHSKNYMRYSTLHYKIGSALDDFAQLQAHVRIYSGWSLAMQFWVG